MDQFIYAQGKSVSLQADTYLLGHPLVFKLGASATYHHPFWQKGRRQISFSPRVGFVSLPNVEQKFIVNPAVGIQYNTKRLFLSGAIGIQYVASVLAYDRYEYEAGILKKQSSTLHNLGTSLSVAMGYRFRLFKSVTVVPFSSVSISQFNSGYAGGLREGQKLGFSMGIQCSLKKS